MATLTLATKLPAPGSAGEPRRLLSLQVGRGLAAVSVALYHARVGTDNFVERVPDWLTAIVQHANLGIDFFFVLSGFIILHAHYDDERGPRALKAYVLKRIARIYIPYLPITAVVIAIYLLLPDLSRNPRDWGWWTSVFLVPSEKQPALLVAWTLVHEMMFYSGFMLFYAGRRVFFLVVLGWVAAIVSTSHMHAAMSPWPSTLLNPLNLEFVLGMACGLAYRWMASMRHAPAAACAVLATGAAIATFYFAAFDTLSLDRLWFAVGASLVLLGAVLLEHRFERRIPQALVELGDASYAIYLIHNPVISVTSRVAAKLPVLNVWFVSLAFSMIVIVAAGWLYYRLYERPALVAFRRQVLARIGR
jgi:peptidoglycan/LPS O-acetylase OafA/YrhL